MDEEVINRSLYGMFGYEGFELTFDPSIELIEGLEELSNAEIWKSKPEVLIARRKKSDVLRDARNFFNRHFKLHLIPYKETLGKLDLLIVKAIKNLDMVASMCNATNIYIHPFMLPVEFSASVGDTMVITNTLLLDDMDFYNKLKVSYQRILLQENVNETTEHSYVHEITHTQLTKEKGVIKQYIHSEVLPIFVELLNLYESGNSNILLLDTFWRLNELFGYIGMMADAEDGIEIEHCDLITGIVYGTSILKAYGLFLDYLNGSKAQRDDILKSVQKVFDAELNLEEMLDNYGITINTAIEKKKMLRYCESFRR